MSNSIINHWSILPSGNTFNIIIGIICIPTILLWQINPEKGILLLYNKCLQIIFLTGIFWKEQRNSTLIFNPKHVKSYKFNAEWKSHISKLAVFQELTKTSTSPSHNTYRSNIYRLYFSVMKATICRNGDIPLPEPLIEILLLALNSFSRSLQITEAYVGYIAKGHDYSASVLHHSRSCLYWDQPFWCLWVFNTYCALCSLYI